MITVFQEEFTTVSFQRKLWTRLTVSRRSVHQAASLVFRGRGAAVRGNQRWSRGVCVRIKGETSGGRVFA